MAVNRHNGFVACQHSRSVALHPQRFFKTLSRQAKDQSCRALFLRDSLRVTAGPQLIHFAKICQISLWPSRPLFGAFRMEARSSERSAAFANIRRRFANSTAMQFIAVKTTNICAKRGNIRSQCVTVREQCHDPDI
jgi:hypothetical protein